MGKSIEQGQKIEVKKTEEIYFSSDFWYSRVIENVQEKSNEELEKSIVETLKNEIPNTVSVLMERVCNMQCSHCLFQKEKSSKDFSEKYNLLKIIENIVQQMPTENDPSHFEKPKFIHEGRTLKKWHLDIFEKVRSQRSDMEIGMIDNGSYTALLDELKKRGIKLDWLDISVDGTEESHNLQRDPELRKAYQMAINGLRHAREVTLPTEDGGRISSLYTLTSLNYKDIEKTADFLFSPNPEESAKDIKTEKQLDYIDEFHITTMTPQLKPNFKIEISSEEFKESWNQIQKIAEKYNKKDQQKVFVKIYNHKDLEKLAEAAGPKKLWKALTDENVKNPASVQIGGITFCVDNVWVTYFPYSTWPQETFHIDADGTFREALCQKYTIEELRNGKAKDGSDITAYTVKQLDKNTPYIETYKEGIDNWWQNFGKRFLREEVEVMENIKNKSVVR